MNRYLKISLIAAGSLIALFIMAGVVISVFFAEDIKLLFIKEINKNLATEVKLNGGMEFSIFRNFPNASVSFYDVEIRESIEGSEKNAIEAGEISLLFNIWHLIRGSYEVEKILIEDGTIDLLVQKDGTVNYKFWKESESAEPSSEEFKLELNKARLINVTVSYKDETLPQHYAAHIKNGFLSGAFSATRYTMFVDLDLHTKTLSVKGAQYLPDSEIAIKMNLDIDSENETYKFQSGSLTIKGDKYDIDGEIMNREKATDMDIAVKGDNISLQSLISLLPPQYTKALKDFDSKGNLVFSATVKGTSSSKSNPHIAVDFSLADGRIFNKQIKKEFEKVQLKGSFSNGKQNSLRTTFLNIPQFKAVFDKKPFDFRLNIVNFEDPSIDLALNADLDLKMIGSLLEDENLNSFEGRVLFNKLAVKGKFRDMRSGRNMAAITSTGNIKLDNTRFKYAGKNFDVFVADLRLNSNKLSIDNIELVLDGSDFIINGSVNNLLTYIANAYEGVEGNVLEIEGNIKSNFLDLNKLIAYEWISADTTASPDANYLYPFKMFHGRITAEVEKFRYDNFNARSLITEAWLSPEAIQIERLEGSTVEGRVNLTAGRLYVQDDKFLIYSSKANLKNINITQLFKSFDNFGQTVLTADHIEGTLFSNLDMTLVWDQKLNFISDRFYMLASVEIKDGELYRFEPLRDLSAYVKVSELEHIKFLNLKNEIEIKNSKIIIPAMHIHSTAMNMLMAGEHTFNNEIDYQFKIDLMDVLSRKFKFTKTRLSDVDEMSGGLINIYVAMTGTVDDPKFSVDKRSVKAKLQQHGQSSQTGFFETLIEGVPDAKPADQKIDFEVEDEDDLEYIEWDDTSEKLDEDGTGDEELYVPSIR